MWNVFFKLQQKMEMTQSKSRLAAGQAGIAGGIAYQEDTEEWIVKELHAESAFLYFRLCR